MLNNEVKLLASGDIGLLFRKFAVPGILGLLFIGMQPMVDGAVLGNFVGPDALAGLNLFVPVYTFMSASAVVTGIGCQTIVSMSLGSREYGKALNALKSAFLFLIVYSLIMAVAGVIFANPLSRLLGANDILSVYTADYIRTFSPFFPFLTVLFLGDYMLKATGRPYFALIVLGSVLVLNAVLDLLFVGIFDWGIKGAALATGLALASACLVMLPALLSKKNIVNLHGGKFSFKLIGEMLYNGSSEGLSELSAGITVFLFNWAMMTSLGENGVAAFTAVNYILYLGVQLFVGLSDGIIPILSYNFGAGNHERMKKTLVMGYRTNAFIGAIFFSLMFFSGEFIVRFFFNSSDGSNIEEIIDISSTGAAFVASAFILNGANILSSSFFTSMGEAKTSVVISLLRGLVLIAAGIVIWPFIFGENGLWVVIPAAETLTSIYCLYILRKKVSWN